MQNSAGVGITPLRRSKVIGRAPRAAYQKGRVESGIKYVKGNFFHGRDLSQLPADRPLESLNTQLRLCMENVASVREHKELRRRPIDLLAADRAAMLPLNANLCDTGRLTTVRVTGYTFRVRLARNRYGKFFVSFLPAISDKAGREIREEMRSWKLHLRSDKSLEDLSRMFNPVVRDWVQ